MAKIDLIWGINAKKHEAINSTLRCLITITIVSVRVKE